MSRFVAFFVTKPVTTLMLYLALGIFGLLSAFSADLDFLPNFANPKIVVSASYPGLPAVEIRELLAIPIEDAFSSVNGIKNISSLSRPGVCVVTLTFQWGRDMDMASAEVRERIDEVYPALPDKTKKPSVFSIHPGDPPVMLVGLLPRGENLALVRGLAEKEVRTRLQQVEGVGMVVLIGGMDDEIHVFVDQERVLAADLSLGYISGTLRASGISLPAGSIVEGEREYVVKTDGKVGNLEDLGGILIPRPDGAGIWPGVLRLRDIAKIETGGKDQESGFIIDGKEGIALVIQRRHGYSPVRLAENVGRELKRIEEAYGKDVAVLVVRDGSAPIKESLRSLSFSVLLGAGVAFAVVLLFMKRLFVSLIILASFPVSILFCLLMLKITGATLNIMSLGGILLGIGMVVDNSIVVLENIESAFGVGCIKFCGEDALRTTIIEKTAEMAGSTFGATVTTLIVFLPVLFLPGIMGVLFLDLALSAAFSLIGSYFCSVSLVPTLYFMIVRRRLKEWGEKNPWIQRRPSRRLLEKRYRRSLAFLLKKPLCVIPLILGSAVIGGLAARNVRFEIMPGIFSKEVVFTVTLPPETPMESTKETTVRLQKALLESGVVESVWARTGGEPGDPRYQADGLLRKGVVEGGVYLRQKEGAREAVGNIFSQTGLDIRIFDSEDLLGSLLGANEKRHIYVFGDGPESARLKAEELKILLERKAGDGAFAIVPNTEASFVKVSPKRDALARTGADLKALADEIAMALDGTVPFSMEKDGKNIDVRVLLKRDHSTGLTELSGLPIKTAAGPALVLGDVGHLEVEAGPLLFLRNGRKDAIRLDDIRGAFDRPDLSKTLSAIVRNSGFASTGEDSILSEQKRNILTSFILALALMYLFLGAQFESFTAPLFILLSLPLGVSGLFAGLAIAGKSLNLYSSLGFLVLLGVSVNTSILLLASFTSSMPNPSGAAFKKRMAASIVITSVKRLKPIAATMLTTVAALTPVAIDPHGRSPQSGMAAAVVGGLVVSSILTALALPPLFFSAGKAGFHGVTGRRTRAKAAGI